MSAWEKDELIGRPHNILLHHDMPKAAFADLWQQVKNGERWLGYVKNLRKDGRYYRTHATVIPNIPNGEIQRYTAVRPRPAPDKVAESTHVYREMRQDERSGTCS